jgi:hypothetical protein
VGWHASDLVKLLGYDRDVVAGIYPKKHGDDAYPVRTLPGEIWSDRDGLIEVAGVPTGFLRIRRRVLETLAERAEKYNAKNDGAYATACIFERQIHDGTRWGGDYVFCRKWRELGGKIHIDPAMRLEHSGEHTWAGSVGSWLRQRSGIGLDAGLMAIREGRERPEDIVDLIDAWGNSFAADATLLMGLALMARVRGGPILECGSGLSSLVMAAANPAAEIHCLESSPVFAEHLRIEAAKHGLKNIRIHLRPIRNGWYDGFVPALPWRLALIDGPPRKDGRRVGVFERVDLSQAAVFADDVQGDGGSPEMLEILRRTHDVEVIDVGVRAFAVAAPREQIQTKAA